jgi:hypothetical protein
MLSHYFPDKLCISESIVTMNKTDLEIFMDLRVLKKWTLVHCPCECECVCVCVHVRACMWMDEWMPH